MTDANAVQLFDEAALVKAPGDSVGRVGKSLSALSSHEDCQIAEDSKHRRGSCS